MPNLFRLFPVEMYLWVFASTSGFTRMATGAFVFKPSGDLVDALELGLAFDVEAMDSLAQGKGDFLLRFSDARERAGSRAASRFQDPEELTAGDNVECGSLPEQQAEDCEVRTGLHRIADHVIKRLQRSVEPAKVVPDRFGRIDVHWRADPAGQFLKIHVLAVEDAVAIRKRMHLP